MKHSLERLRWQLRRGINTRITEDLKEETASGLTVDPLEDMEDAIEPPFDIDAVKTTRIRDVGIRSTPKMCAFCGKDAMGGLRVTTGECICKECEKKYRKKKSATPTIKKFYTSKRYTVSEDGTDAVLGFGKHSGKALTEIKYSDPSYLDWMLHQDFPPELIDVVRYVKSGIFRKRLKRKRKIT